MTRTGLLRSLGGFRFALGASVLVGCGLLPSPSTVATTEGPVDPTPASPDGDACPGVARPEKVRITELVLHDIDTGPLGRPVVAGCAVWIASGDNNGGIHRIDLATGEVANVNPAEVVLDVDSDGSDLLALGRPAILKGDAETRIFRIDPATGATLGQLPVDGQATALRLIDGRAWVSGLGMDVKVYDLANGAVIASVPVGDPSAIEVGMDAVWIVESLPDGHSLSRLDRSTFELTAVPIPDDLTDVAFGKRLYIGTESGEVSQIDPTTGAVVASVKIPGWTAGFIGLAAEGSSVWALPVRMVPVGSEFRLESSELIQIDAVTAQIVNRIPYEAVQPLDLWATDSNLWLYEAERPVHRFELPSLP